MQVRETDCAPYFAAACRATSGSCRTFSALVRRRGSTLASCREFMVAAATVVECGTYATLRVMGCGAAVVPLVEETGDLRVPLSLADLPGLLGGSIVPFRPVPALGCTVERLTVCAPPQTQIFNPRSSV